MFKSNFSIIKFSYLSILSIKYGYVSTGHMTHYGYANSINSEKVTLISLLSSSLRSKQSIGKSIIVIILTTIL